jgi:phosphoglycolate phosphatase-like HAD superfamily hydrolase
VDRLALFDIDCTLIDAHGAGGRAIRRALEVVYGRWEQADGYTYHGRTDPQIVRDLAAAGGVPPDEIDAGMVECLDAYVRCLRSEVAAGAVEVLPGVRQLLAALADDDRVVLGLLTGNIIGGAGVKLGPTGLAGYFRVGAYGSDSSHRPDLPEIALRRAAELTGRRFAGKEVAVIGDSPADVACGEKEGVKALAVATGHHTRDELAACGPDYLFDDLSDWRAALAAILA